ncbi:MAG: hypothetical protein ACP5OG_03890 [Candidatus Nanoarchaeia archaeon]
MKYKDKDYLIMEHLDFPMGNKVPVMWGNILDLGEINEQKFNMPETIKNLDRFSGTYNIIKNGYAKFQRLEDNITQQHGRNIIEKCKILINEIDEPFLELKKAFDKKDLLKFKGLVNKIQELTCSLLEEVANYSRIDYYKQYRHLQELNN